VLQMPSQALNATATVCVLPGSATPIEQVLTLGCSNCRSLNLIFWYTHSRHSLHPFLLIHTVCNHYCLQAAAVVVLRAWRPL
jgi:hypothetical protein